MLLAGLGTLALLLVLADVAALAVREVDRAAPFRAGQHGVLFLLTEVPRWWTLPLRLASFSFAERFAPLELPSVAMCWVVAFLAVDGVLYAWHRALHETALGRAFHDAHHSADAFDLSVGARVHPVQRWFDDLIYLPIVFLGVPATTLVATIALNRAFQFWAHTRHIGRLRWLDPWLNTPANHRVHHRSVNDPQAKNYGSALMIWDRLFGSYAAESPHDERPYASTRYSGDDGWHRAILAPLERYWRERAPTPAPATDPSPLALRWAFSILAVVSLGASIARWGPASALWLCSVGNVLLVASFVWLPRLLTGAATLALGPVWLLYAMDALMLALGLDGLGIADYLLDPAFPLPMRILSSFHLVAPAVAAHRVGRLGLDPRAPLVALGVVAITLSLSYALSSPGLRFEPGVAADHVARLADINGTRALGGFLPPLAGSETEHGAALGVLLLLGGVLLTCEVSGLRPAFVAPVGATLDAQGGARDRRDEACPNPNPETTPVTQACAVATRPASAAPGASSPPSRRS